MNLCSILRKKIIQLLKYCYCNITWTKSHETDLQKNYLNTPNYQQYGTDGFSWVSHVDGTIITHHFRHVWQCSTVIKMKMTEIIITVSYENSQNLRINFVILWTCWFILIPYTCCHLLAHLKHRGEGGEMRLLFWSHDWIGEKWNY